MKRKDKERRFSRLKMIPCVACLLGFVANAPGGVINPHEIHHQNFDGRAGQRKLGDEFTIPLCRWHHRGIPPSGMLTMGARSLLGPSMALQSKAFRLTYGKDPQLLQFTNEILTRLA